MLNVKRGQRKWILAAVHWCTQASVNEGHLGPNTGITRNEVLLLARESEVLPCRRCPAGEVTQFAEGLIKP